MKHCFSQGAVAKIAGVFETCLASHVVEKLVSRLTRHGVSNGWPKEK